MKASRVRVSDLKDIIYHKNLKIGTLWIIASSLIFELLTLYYQIKDYDTLSTAGVVASYAQAILLVASIVVLTLAFKSKRASHPTWLVAAILLGLFWTVATASVAHFGNAPEPASRGVLIGAFTLVIGWYARPSLLYAAFVLMWGTYINILISFSAKTLMGMLLSIIKFPLLIGLSLYSLRYWLSFCTDKFVENEVLTEKLEAMIRIDALTKIANRRGYEEAIEQAVHTASRSHTPLTLLFFDIDFFKQYNDQLGHYAGDRCLKAVASIIKKYARRTTDTAARIGGEEFALILPNCTAEQATSIAYGIQETIKESELHHPTSTLDPHVTVSIGIAEYVEKDSTHTLYRKADNALYAAKQKGRNQYVIFSPETLAEENIQPAPCCCSAL